MLLGALLQLLRNQNRNVLQSISPHHEIFMTASIKEEKGNATIWVLKHNHHKKCQEQVLIGLTSFSRSGLQILDYKLQAFEYYTDNGNQSRRSFRFAVVEANKSKSYPQNFVCMLPSQFGKGKTDSAFLKLFGAKSLEQARSLLKTAWEMENDSDIKAEIERRLKLLEPKAVNQIKCSSCGTISLFTLMSIPGRILSKFSISALQI